MVDEDEFAGSGDQSDRCGAGSGASGLLCNRTGETKWYGYGSRGLEAVLLERFKNHKYIFEIETQDEKAENAEERKRKKGVLSAERSSGDGICL